MLPPAVAGIGLFAAFGRMGLLGAPLQDLGIRLPFTWVAVVMAQAFVAMPFYVRQAVAAFASIDPQLLGASRTLGAGPSRTFLRVAVPLARQESVGRRGTRLGARSRRVWRDGSLRRQPPRRSRRRCTLAIYSQFSAADFNAALAMSALLVAVSFGILVTAQASLALSGTGREVAMSERLDVELQQSLGRIDAERALLARARDPGAHRTLGRRQVLGAPRHRRPLPPRTRGRIVLRRQSAARHGGARGSAPGGAARSVWSSRMARSSRT